MKKRIWVLVAVTLLLVCGILGVAIFLHSKAPELPLLVEEEAYLPHSIYASPVYVADDRVLLSGAHKSPEYADWLYIPSTKEYIPVATADGYDETWNSILANAPLARRFYTNLRDFADHEGSLGNNSYHLQQGTRYYTTFYQCHTALLDTQTGALYPSVLDGMIVEGTTDWQHLFFTDRDNLYVCSLDETFQQVVPFPEDQKIIHIFALHDGLLVITCGELTTSEYGLGRIGDVTAWLLDKELNITQSIPFGRMNTPDNYLFFKRCWESPDHKRIVLTNRLGMPCVIDRRAGTAQILIDHDGKYTTHTAAAGVEVPISYRNAPLGMSKDGRYVLLFHEDRGILCFHPDTFDVHLIIPVDELDPDWLEYGLFYDFTWFGGDYAMAGSQIFRVNLPEHD